MSKQRIREFVNKLPFTEKGNMVINIDKMVDFIHQYTQEHSGWNSVEDRLPAIGQHVILFANRVIQNETYYLDAGDSSDYHTEYFWVNNHKDCTEDTYELKSGQKWMPLPEPPVEER